MKRLAAPASPEAITRDWLSEVLEQSGTISRSRVASFTRKKVGDAGFIGELARLELDYLGAKEDGPMSLIAKFSNRDPRQRSIFHGIGLYEREVRFYSEFADHSPLRTPRCYYGEIDPDTGHSILLLEDLSHLRTIDVSTGCDLPEARLLTRDLAAFHAYWWNRPEVVAVAHEAPVERILRIWHALYRSSWPQFPDRLRQVLPEIELPPEFLDLGDRLSRSSGDLFAPLAQPPVTLVHMDIHLDNLAFDSPESALPPVIFDWQTLGVGRGVIDLAYFVISALPVAVRRQEEQNLMEMYHDLLRGHGVRGYSLADCWADYVRASLWNLLLLPGMIADDIPSSERLRYVDATLPRVIAFLCDHSVARRLESRG